MEFENIEMISSKSFSIMSNAMDVNIEALIQTRKETAAVVPYSLPVVSHKKQIASKLIRFRVALIISLFATLFSLSLALATFYQGNSSIYTAFGVDCILGTLTAIILVWRFATVDPDPLRDQMKEVKSNILLGSVMAFSGVFVIIRTIVELAMHLIISTEEQQHSVALEPLSYLALICCFGNVFLLIGKFAIYYYQKANSMFNEAVSSMISAAFAFVTMVSITFSDQVQYLEQVVSIGFGIFLIGYGYHEVRKALHQKRLLLVGSSPKVRSDGYQRLV